MKPRTQLPAGVAACAIGVVDWDAAICVWHLAHSAVPTNPEREAADLVGHQPGESMRSSVGSETSEVEFELRGELLAAPVAGLESDFNFEAESAEAPILEHRNNVRSKNATGEPRARGLLANTF